MYPNLVTTDRSYSPAELCPWQNTFRLGGIVAGFSSYNPMIKAGGPSFPKSAHARIRKGKLQVLAHAGINRIVESVLCQSFPCLSEVSGHFEQSKGGFAVVHNCVPPVFVPGFVFPPPVPQTMRKLRHPCWLRH